MAMKDNIHRKKVLTKQLSLSREERNKQRVRMTGLKKQMEIEILNEAQIVLTTLSGR